MASEDKHMKWDPNILIQGKCTQPVSRYAQPIPGTNILPSQLPAGEASSPMLHFFIPLNDDDYDSDQEVYIQQLAQGHGEWNEDSKTHLPGTHSDDYGFRLSVDGRLYAVRGVDVWTLEPAAEDSSIFDMSEWHLWRFRVGDRGMDAFKLMFNTEVLLPSVNVTDIVKGVLLREVGPDARTYDPRVMDPRSVSRFCAARPEFVRDRTGFGSVDRVGSQWVGDDGGGARVFQFCTVAMFCDPRTKIWEFHIYCFSILIEDWPVHHKFNERIGRAKARRPILNFMPAGQQSHSAFFMVDKERKIELHQLLYRGKQMSGSHGEEFGCSFIIDGVRRRILGVDTWIMESDFDDKCSAELFWLNYDVGNDGADAYKIIFNTELLDQGNEHSVMDAVLSGVPKLDAASIIRKQWVAKGLVRLESGRRTGGGGSRGEAGTFTFMTCTAFGVGGEWEFMLFMFQISYGSEMY